MKLTQQDIARLLNVTPMTIRNWKKDKPYLYEIIMKGFAFEEAIKQAQRNADELKALAEEFKTKK
jgi:transcriptional regulator with XRE-family HTH domain